MSLVAYKNATDLATAELPSTHPIRLGLALNFSVFYYEILNSPDRACRLVSLSFYLTMQRWIIFLKDLKCESLGDDQESPLCSYFTSGGCNASVRSCACIVPTSSSETLFKVVGKRFLVHRLY